MLALSFHRACGALTSSAMSAFLFLSTACAQSPAEKPQNVPPKIRWRIEQQVDKLDGKSITAAQKTAFETTLYPHRRPPVTDKLAALQVNCNKGKTVVYFAVNGSLVASRGVQVSYRIDSEPPVKGRVWTASEDSSAVGMWEPQVAISFIKKLIPSRKIFLRIEHNVFGTTEAEFDTTELAEAIKPVRAACGW